MGDWIKLIKYSKEYITCGAILRIPSKKINRQHWYRDDVVDLMVFYAGAAFDGAGYGLIAASGYKAGSINTTFPIPESSGGAGALLRTDWLVRNWNSRVYPDGDVTKIWIREPRSIDSNWEISQGGKNDIV